MKCKFRAVTVVAMSILMVTGAVAPVAATGQRGGPLQGTDVNRTGILDDDRSALEHRFEAYELLHDAGEQRQLDHLNATFEHLLDRNRVDARAVFHEDRLVVAQTQANYSGVAEHLVASDRALAETAVADAEGVVAEMQRRNLSYNETAVEDYLANASEALAEGHVHVQQDEPVAAVEAYQRAWTAAQRALDVMQGAVEPQVTITRREDPPHDGNVTYTVEGVVWDVRSHRMNVSLTINGEHHELLLTNSTVPGENATFARTITLETEVNRINVSVTNTPNYVDYHRVGDRPVGDAGGPPNDDESNSPDDGGPPYNESDGEVQDGFDVLKLDGDGLPDNYEENVLGTVPLHPDSDSRFTDRDESDWGLLDGEKDFSDDGLTAYQEYRIGTDPLVSDTTGDGLEDGFQVLRAGTDPLVNDTDGDGTLDVEEDLSGGGLTLIEEQEHGTNPLVNDTDGDGLADYAEIHEYGTDPLDPDTSGSGLLDGEEVRLGLDPTINETEPGQTFTTTTVDESSGVEVSATGEGVVVNDIYISHVTAQNESEANRLAVDGNTVEDQVVVGPTVRIQGKTDYENAQVTIPIDEDVDLEDTDVQIYRWNPSHSGKWVPLETYVDKENRTATAMVYSFAYYAVFDADAWENVTNATATPVWPALEQFEDAEGWRGDGRVENNKLVVGSGGANFEVTDFKAPDEAWEGDTITINATIENTGTQAGTQRVAYVYAGTAEKFQQVQLEPGEQTSVRFFYTFRQHSDDPVLDLQTFEHAVVTDDDRWNETITVHWGDEDDDDDDDSDGPTFEVTDFEGPGSAQAGDEIDVEATVTNTGDQSGETTVVYHFRTDAVASKTVNLDPGEETTVLFTYLIPALTPTRYYHHNISANDGEDAAGAVIHVEGRGITPDRPGIFTVCLAGQAGGECSGITGMSWSPVSGHYGAAPSGMATDRAPAVGNGDTTDTLATASNESMAVRALSLPDARSIPVQVRVRATIDDENSSAEILLETDSRSYTVFSRTDATSTAEWVTVKKDVRALAGEDARLVVRTEGNATVMVDYVSIMPDSTGDEVPDAVEAMDLRMPVGLEGVRGTPLDLDPTAKDTTGDGLTDDRQIDVEWDIVQEDGSWQVWASVDEAEAHPAMDDTDDDGVPDVKEVNGWNVNVVNKIRGEYAGEDPFRWNSGQRLKPDEEPGQVKFYADPLLTDTSGNGVDDYTEKEVLHTDPRAERTYNITLKHQEEIVDELVAQYNEEDTATQLEIDNMEVAAYVLRIGGVGSPGDLVDLELNDTTDDFSFVTNREGGLTYKGIDYTIRTDTWLTNRKVLERQRGTETTLDPWDADSDDDGLTDGQEIYGVTEFVSATYNEPFTGIEASKGRILPDGGVPYDSLDPLSPDSSGNGWWDGWIGVYGVGYNSENVILYMENLWTGADGLEEHQIVQAQAGVHPVRHEQWPDDRSDLVPAPDGVELQEDGWLYHSNVHMGELHWGSDPSSAVEAPEPGLLVEVDYIEGHDPRKMTTGGDVPVLKAIKRNFGLYGFDISFDVDDKIEIDELEDTCKSHEEAWENLPAGSLDSGLHTLSDEGCLAYVSHEGLNRWELGIVEDMYHSSPWALHLVWGTNLWAQSPGTPIDIWLDDKLDGSTGVAMNNGAPGTNMGGELENEFGVMIAADEITDDTGTNNSTMLQSTTMHELGHALGIGWLDDTDIELEDYSVIPNGAEVYSGDVDGDYLEADVTPEYIEIGIRNEPEWSIMMRGEAEHVQNFIATDTTHPVLAFSIEELVTIDFEKVPSRGD